MLFQLEALELYFIHPLGFGLTSGTKRNIIVVTPAKAGGSAGLGAGPDPRQPGRERLPRLGPCRRPGRGPQPLTGAAPLPQPSPSTAAGLWVGVPPRQKKSNDIFVSPKRQGQWKRQPGCGVTPRSVPSIPPTPGRAALPAPGGPRLRPRSPHRAVPPGSGRRAGPGAFRSSSRSVF